MFTSSRAKAAWLALSVIVAAFVWTTWPLREVASENSRLLLVFYTDEAAHFDVLAASVAQHTIPIGMGYGYPLFNAARLLLVPIAHPSEQQIVLALRTAEWAFAVATLIAVFVSIRRLSLLAAVLTTALLASLPIFVRWSVISHPDLMQLFFLWVALAACARRLDGGVRRWTIVAAAAAGAAFGAKFAGMFLLPIIWAVDLLPGAAPYPAGVTRLTRAAIVAGAIAAVAAAAVLSPAFVAGHLTADGAIHFEKSVRLIQLARVALVAAAAGGLALAVTRFAVPIVSTLAAFAAAFTVTSPQAWRGLHFVRALIFEASVSGVTHQGSDPWLLVGTDMISWGVAGFAIAGVVWVLVDAAKKRRHMAMELVQLAWVAIFGTVLALSLRSHDQPSYYLLPVVPSIVFLAVRADRKSVV